jgi:hypothetical protein
MSAPVKRVRFLSPNRVSELVWDNESDEAGAPSDSMSEDKYSPFEHLYKRRVIFGQYIPKKHKHFGIKITNYIMRMDIHII